MSHGTPPVIPTEFRQYNSYVEDPKWQTRFTLMWCSLLGFCIFLAVPRVMRGLRSRAALAGFAGVHVAALYAPLPSDDGALSPQSTIVDDDRIRNMRLTARHRHWFHKAASLLSSLALWSVPGIDLNVGQLLVVVAYSVFTLVSIILKAPLMSNPNRAGFLALAQLPPVFLFAMKNSPVALLLGPGVDYTKLNYVHRWAGRGLFLGAVIHGAIWVQNHLTWNLPILSRQKEATGVAALGCLCIIVLSSVAPLRRRCYTLFLVIHYLTFPTFFVTICYHTPFVYPWIFPPIAFYAFDVFLRLLKFRVVVARVRACDGGMSIISISAASTGWRAGQHVQVRALLGGRTFVHSHPLTILSAPPDTTCLSPPPGLLLAARVCGPWTQALYSFGRGKPPKAFFAGSLPAPDPEKFVLGDTNEEEDEDEFEEDYKMGKEGGVGDGRAVHVILDGPYGGPSLDPGLYGDVLFLAGGSGVTATLGQLDDLVGRCVRRGRERGERTQRVEWVWCVRDADALSWFAPQLAQITDMAASPGSGLVLRIRIFVTGAGVAGNASRVSGYEVCAGRPIARALLNELVLTEGPILSGKDTEYGAADSAAGAGAGIGLAVFAAGPRGLMREAGNAVARLNLRKRVCIDFCAETFVI
ncbi:ferric reductase like transmembrane component-domain-containing protein [Mycena vulgaris]|nr:ferric reductase like transmembrane component-domain-containing protein [Mycena vulgaris]